MNIFSLSYPDHCVHSVNPNYPDHPGHPDHLGHPVYPSHPGHLTVFPHVALVLLLALVALGTLVTFFYLVTWSLDHFKKIKFWKFMLHRVDSWSWDQLKLVSKNILFPNTSPPL